MVSHSLRLIDCLFSEFSAACEVAEVIEETVVSGGLKELVVTLAWTAPGELHVVVIVDEVQHEDRVVTVYEPELARWSADFRRRQSGCRTRLLPDLDSPDPLWR